jgi:hypothetical protein
MDTVVIKGLILDGYLHINSKKERVHLSNAIWGILIHWSSL